MTHCHDDVIGKRPLFPNLEIIGTKSAIGTRLVTLNTAIDFIINVEKET